MKKWMAIKGLAGGLIGAPAAIRGSPVADSSRKSPVFRLVRRNSQENAEIVADRAKAEAGDADRTSSPVRASPTRSRPPVASVGGPVNPWSVFSDDKCHQ